MKAFIWIADCVLVLIIASLAVYRGPAQMESLRLVLKQLQQVYGKTLSLFKGVALVGVAKSR
uniref:Gustatory receptor GR8.2 n=1 Tax=Lobesia botrana TaxID=209534 RepID=A0A345BF02_9NEOP|nr:gustatory receptor GR8.2 [Lobesia botrana]